MGGLGNNSQSLKVEGQNKNRFRAKFGYPDRGPNGDAGANLALNSTLAEESDRKDDVAGEWQGLINGQDCVLRQ